MRRWKVCNLGTNYIDTVSNTLSLLAVAVNVAYVAMGPLTAERGTALAVVKLWLCVVSMAISL